MMRLAIVIPTLNEAATIEPTLLALAPLRRRGVSVIVADGGSADNTVARAATFADRVIAAPRGRALQMNAGARAPEALTADVLLFLHADTFLPEDADRIVLRALANSDRVWGRFDVLIDGRSRWLRLVSAMMNLRSRLSGIATGDQALFVERSSFVALEGFAPIALMEDVEFCARAKRLSRPLALPERVRTSGRRWERNGVWRTIVLMWQLRWAFYFGADPAELARRYRHSR
ncbi:MAG TPA: TIGR04283 family arsenosugar biosynthesis glycosyltransferase [Burkholderiaceae bacterium]|nr:TIGR04283 family arsenosugar biosynthesis glycosyltransferase [Burkholderiaceae bacterium]